MQPEYMIVLGLFLILALALFMGVLILFLNKQNQRTLKTLSENFGQSQKLLVDLLSKQTALLGAKDPLAFQAIQAMDQTTTPLSSSEEYDPSDEAEIERLERLAGRRGNSDADGFDAERFEDLDGLPNLGYIRTTG